MQTNQLILSVEIIFLQNCGGKKQEIEGLEDILQK